MARPRKGESYAYTDNWYPNFGVLEGDEPGVYLNDHDAVERCASPGCRRSDYDFWAHMPMLLLVSSGLLADGKHQAPLSE